MALRKGWWGGGPAPFQYEFCGCWLRDAGCGPEYRAAKCLKFPLSLAFSHVVEKLTPPPPPCDTRSFSAKIQRWIIMRRVKMYWCSSQESPWEQGVLTIFVTVCLRAKGPSPSQRLTPLNVSWVRMSNSLVSVWVGCDQWQKLCLDPDGLLDQRLSLCY